MSFKDELISGAAYTAIAKYLGLVVGLGVSAILSRILTPEDFGVIAIAMVLIGFITLLGANGMGPAIIQNRTLSKQDVEDIFAFTVYLSVVATGFFAACAPLVATVYGDPQLTEICLLLSLNLLFSFLNIVPNALLFKHKRFKYIAKRTIYVQLSLGLVSVVSAIYGAGIYALLINPILGSTLLFLISYRCYKIPFRFKINWEPVTRILPFSLYQIGFNVINYFYRSIDKLLIGRCMGLNQLGYYEKSYRLMMMPLENVSNVINPVLHPLLCEHQNDPSFIFDKYKKVIQYFAYLGFIISAVSYFCSYDLIILIFGSQWIASVAVFRIFSLSIGIQLVQSAVGAVFQSTGHVKQLFLSGCYSLLCMIVAIVVGLASNRLTQLAVCIVVAFYVMFIIYHYFLIVRVMHRSLLNFIEALVRPLISSIIVGGALWCYSFFVFVDSLFIDLLAKVAISAFMIIALQELGVIRDIPSILTILCKPFKKYAKRD